MKSINKIWEMNKEKLPVGYKKLHLLNKVETNSKIDYNQKSFQFKKYPVEFKNDQVYDKEISNIVIDD